MDNWIYGNILFLFLYLTRTWIKINDLSDGDAYIVGKGTIDLLAAAAANANDKAEKVVAFKNNAPFRLCISKINNTLICNTEYLDIVMLMYNLLE